jgi:hypothetical protein
MEFRNIIADSDTVAFGCSHTWGVGVEANETWAYKLGAKNFGMGSCSADYILRIAPDIIKEHNPAVVYVLWPDWTRFEYVKNGKYYQSLPSDSNRIHFMETHPEEWLLDNFAIKAKEMFELCNKHNIRLIDMTLYDLIPYMDHADKWPISKLGHHYAPEWHTKVADIFRNADQNNIQHPLSNT